MLSVLLVGAGGFIGSVLRYLSNTFVLSVLKRPDLPIATLVVNVAGCFIIGLLGGLSETKNIFSHEARMFIFIGLLGGFTTFSTFGYEVFIFAKDGQLLHSLVNLFLQIVLGIGAVWCGYSLSQFAFAR